ncbi:NACHT domain-containing protein [Nonomuraea pusilla]|uniref:NACHT domain-containing protein n=1 Tax=Nonomuraea pusilla TaxID=46177 RepID=A0A1H7VN04_9ACTN|nr:NACHT domain-containing protein [Nonomuraea pusilla]SEM10235.1 NACHT domain-containing protein [Nonomuraea pusilla]
MTEIIVALIGLVGVLVTAVFGYVQWRRTQLHAMARERPPTVPAPRTRTEEKALDRRRGPLLERLADDLRHVSLLNRARPLDLDTLYVQLRMHNQEPLRYVQPQEIQDLRGKEFTDLHRLTRARQEERAGEPLTPEEALTRLRRVVVLGDPGAGKTTMLRYLALQAARGSLSGTPCLPVFVELRQFVRTEAPDLLAYVQQAWAERYGERDAADLADHALTKGEAVLLLDGLDEVLGGESRDAADQVYRKVVQEIDRLAARYPDARIAVTCRRAGWRGQLPAFRTLEVLDFDDAQIKVFVTHWFESDPARAAGLTAALGRNARIRTLSANPLLLSLIAIVYESDLELPERRSELYKRTVSVLLSEWDAHRDIRRFARFTSDRKRDLLEEIAWHFHRQGLAYFPKDELLKMIADFLPSIALDPVDAPHILTEITEQYGLLKEQAHEVYGFLHLTLQEFFAAEVAARVGYPAIEEISRARHDPWWEEVILLLAGRLHDATPLLLGLLDRTGEPPPGEPVAARDDLFHSDLFLAARCLGGVPRVKAAWLRERVVAEVRAIMLESTHEFLYVEAARLYAEICPGEPVTRATLPPDRRERIAEALNLDDLDPVGTFTAPVPNDLAAYARVLDDLGLTHDAGPKALAPLAPEWLARLAPHYRHPEAANALAGLVEAAGAERVSAAVPAVRSLMETALEDTAAEQLLTPCRKALVRLEVIRPEELWDLLAWGRSGQEGGLVELLTEADPSAGWRPLFDALVDPRTDTYYTDELSRHLAATRDPELVGPVLSSLRNHDIPWPVRWHLCETLDAFDTREPLMKIVNDDGEHRMVRIGCAATLVRQGHRDGVPTLLDAVRDDVITSDSLRTRHHVSPFGYLYYFANPARRVFQALGKCGDPAVAPTLLACFDLAVAAAPPTSDQPAISGKADLLVDALADAAPDEINHRLLGLLGEIAPVRRWRGVYTLGYELRTALRPGQTARTLAALRAMDLPMGAASDLSRLLEEVGDIAGDSATVAELVAVLDDPEPLWDRAAALTALHKVSRRARVRITPDIRMEG